MWLWLMDLPLCVPTLSVGTSAHDGSFLAFPGCLCLSDLLVGVLHILLDMCRVSLPPCGVPF